MAFVPLLWRDANNNNRPTHMYTFLQITPKIVICKHNLLLMSDVWNTESVVSITMATHENSGYISVSSTLKTIRTSTTPCLMSDPYRKAFFITWLLSLENLYHLYHFVRDSQPTFLDSLQTFNMGAAYIQLILSLLTDSPKSHTHHKHI